MTSEDELDFEHAIAALPDGETRLRAIIENAGEGIVLALPDGRYFFVNQRMTEMLGYEHAELIGKSSNDLAYDGWGPTADQVRTALPDGRPSSGEFQFRRKDGTLLWTRWNAMAIHDEQGRHVANLGMHTDVTEQKETERRLAFQADLLEEARDAMIASDEQLRIRHWSAGSERLFGWKAEEVVGKLAVEVLRTRIPGSTREAVLSQIEHEGSFEGEVLYARKDGTDVLVEVHSRVLRDEDGAFAGMISSFHDVTERRRAEEGARQGTRSDAAPAEARRGVRRRGRARAGSGRGRRGGRRDH